MMDHSQLSFHSDDYGYNEENDMHLLELLEEGKLQSVSVLATMVKATSLRDLVALNRTKKFRIALHFNIIEGKSLCHPDHIPSLVSHHGSFYQLPHLFFNILRGRVEPQEVAMELRKQLTFLKDRDVNVTMIDSHQHTHALSPIAEVVLKIAQEYELQEVRPYHNVKTYSLHSAVKYTVLKSMAFMSHLATYDRFSLPATWEQADKHEYSFMSWEDGSFDIMKKGNKNTWYVVHPGLGYDTNKTYEPYFKTG